MPYKNRMISVTVKVNDEKYERLRQLAGDKTVAEWVRQVLDAELERRPFEQQFMEQLWALRYVVLNVLPHTAPNQVAAAEEIHKLIGEADQKKADKARAILKGTR